MENVYLTLRYNSKDRWLDYWYRIYETLEVSPESVLVIGKGSGITEDVITLFTNNKTRVLTLDINYAFNSDVVGSVLALPFTRDAFDVVICCQVLEYLPFKKFPAALGELHRVANRRVILSIPHRGAHLKLGLNLPYYGERNIIFKNPLIKRDSTDRNLPWDIGKHASRKQVVQHLSRLFVVEKEFLNEAGCNQRYFILKRRKFI